MREPSDPGRQLVHDLRSALMVIDGFASLLARDDGSLTAEERADYTARIRAAATDMRAILDRAAAPGGEYGVPGHAQPREGV